MQDWENPHCLEQYNELCLVTLARLEKRTHSLLGAILFLNTLLLKILRLSCHNIHFLNWIWNIIWKHQTSSTRVLCIRFIQVNFRRYNHIVINTLLFYINVRLLILTWTQNIQGLMKPDISRVTFFVSNSCWYISRYFCLVFSIHRRFKTIILDLFRGDIDVWSRAMLSQGFANQIALWTE